MKMFHLLSATALASVLVVPAAADAQDQNQTPAAQPAGPSGVEDNTENAPTDRQARERAPGTGGDIVVTGTRIANPNVASPVPVTSLNVESLRNGSVSLGDALNQLPSARATYSQSNSTQFIGTSGLNLLDLRGLGVNRTLTLVDGRRTVTATPGDESVDVNTIPTELVERIDIVTGGNSAIYGSDAVAGVANFVLKRNFSGVEANAQSGVSSRGDRPSYNASLTVGQNFLDDRANIAVNVGYARADALYYTDRDQQYGGYSGRHQFNRVQNVLGEPSTGDGVPDDAFLINVKNNNISNGGLVSSVCPTAVASTAANFAIVQARRAQNCTGAITPTGGEIGRTYVFNSLGNLVANPVQRDLRNIGSSNAVGGLGSTLFETSQLDPQFERKTANLLASFEFSDAARVFFQGRYVDLKSVQAGQATFFNNTFSINNPFLTDANRSLLRQIYGRPTGDFNFSAQRYDVDFGPRGENHDRETYNLTGGIGGKFNDDWKYEVAVTYGHTKTFYQTEGNVDTDKYANSIDAVRAPNGQIVCGINADDDPTNDDAACVPINTFGDGIASAQTGALNYFGIPSQRRQTASLFDVTAYVSGDLSQLFTLPGGPIAFSVGGEYRTETAFSGYDALTKSSNTFLNAFDDFTPPKLKVKEAFGEVQIPLLADLPLIRELSLNASGRLSDYNVGSTGTVFAWNLSGTYSPVKDLRFRVGYAKSVRAPTLSDLYGAASQDFALITDPCDQSNINNGPNRVKNCAAAGVPVTEIDPATGKTIAFTNTPSSSISGISGGNPDLREETGYSFTAGAVYQPSFVPGLTLSVDYYNIRIKNVIFSLDAQTLINQCYDSPSGNDNPYCAAVTRNADGSFGGQADKIINGVTYDLPGTGNGFREGSFNFARQQTSGVDFDANYFHSFGGGLKANLHAIVAYVLKRNNYTDISDPGYIDRQLSELGDPIWKASLLANIDFGKFDLNYNFRFVGKQTIGLYEDQHSLQGRPPTNPDLYPVVNYPNVTYSDVRVGVDASDVFRFYVGVDNLFDKDPPYGLDGTGDDAIYDNIGRFFYAGARIRF